MRELDLLRFVAAIAVVLFHYTARQNPAWGGVDPVEVFPGLSQVTRYGFLGVQLFFMISGFVILLTAWKRGVGEFVIARATRLYPAYIVAVVLTAVTVTYLSDLDYRVEPLQVLTNLTMTQSALGVADVDGVYWSLWVELRFYAIVALLVLYGVTYRTVVAFMGLWLVATIALRAAPVAFLDLMLFPRWSQYFIAGMAFYLIRRFGSNVVLWSIVFLSWILAMAEVPEEAEGVGRIVTGGITSTGLAIGITATFAVMALVAVGGLSFLTWKWLTPLGLLTYPLYLLHEWIGWAMIDAVRESLPPWETLILVTVSMIALSWAVARLIEAPLSAWTRRSLNHALHEMRHHSSERRSRRTPAA